MKIIIVGIGKLGEFLAHQLVKDENEVTVVDKNFSHKVDIINNLDVNYVEGNGLDSNVLLEAGIKSSDLLISVMEKDESNIMCSLIGKKLGAKHTIARIRTPEYTNSINLLKDDLGLSMVINPEYQTAVSISKTLNIPSALVSTSFLKGRIDVISLKIKEDNHLDKISIDSLSKKIGINIIVCAIERDGKTIIPKGNTKLYVNDKIHVTGTRRDINTLLKYMGLISKKPKKVMIAGGSSISKYLTDILIDMGIGVKIIEINPDRCLELTESLPKATIVNGDCSDQKILSEEGLDKYDAFVALTSIDEENIVYSMYASLLKVPKIVTKINHIKLDGVVEKSSIDISIAPHKIATNNIVQYVRAMNNSTGSTCEAVYKFDDIFEMIEFNVKDDFKYKDISLKNLNLKDGILISAIQRGKNIIFPNGLDKIEVGDIIVVVNYKNKLNSINDIVE